MKIPGNADRSARSALGALVVSLALLGAGCPPAPISPVVDAGSITPAEADQCDAEPAGVAPRPLWTEQPDRDDPFTTIDHDASSLGQVVTCDPNKLGEYPAAEGGNAHPKGADLQNISTNFHVLQSLTMSASIASKALAKLNKFKTDINAPGGMLGKCSCQSVSSQCITTTDQTRGDCDTFCSTGACTGGTLAWVPNDAFKSTTGAAKFAIKQLTLLDELREFVGSPVYTAISDVLSAFSAAVENVTEIIARMACWIDLFTEGYHLGAFDEQRPDLHMCVGYYGHGAFAGIGEPGKFEIGGRYASHNLSTSHRAQMRSGGWGVTAFDKTLTMLPNVEFNTQLDDYRFFDKCKPLGFAIGGDASFDCQNGFGIWTGSGAAPAGTIDVDKIDLFHMVDRPQVQTLDSDGNGVVSGGEFIVAGYQPFRYPDATLGPYQWPRTDVDASWEGQVASVVSTGLNIDPHITPIERPLGTYILYPGVTFIPILTLQAGIEWQHEAYDLRSRLLGAVNKNLAPGLQLATSDFERKMHAMQAPDLTADTGVGAFVTPGVKGQLTVGLVVSKYLEIGISGFTGLELDIRPAAHGGLTDLSLELTDALNASNPPAGACSPVLETTAHAICSDKSFDTQQPNHSNPESSYACTPADAEASCCVKLGVRNAAGPVEQLAICLDDWTGITEGVCACNEGVQACYDKIKKHVSPGAHAKIEGWLQNGAIASMVPTWSAQKTCQQCDEDGTCRSEWWSRTPSLTSLSDCAQHGSCVIGDATIYDVVEESCQQQGGTFYRYRCAEETATTITGWQGPGCHPLNVGFPSACGCDTNADCAVGETCDATTGKCSATPADCACNPTGNADPAVACGSGRVCVDGACELACGMGGGCRTGFMCESGACVSESGVPYAEQIAWLSDHPSPGPRHAIESYGLTDMTLTLILSAGVRVGATVKLFKKKFEFMVWQWSDAWDLGSTQKAKYQPGLEVSYLDECDGTVGTVTNHQPGTGDPLTCSGGDSYVCRYPSASSADWADHDQPHELIAQCKNAMPDDVEDPPAPTPADFGNAVGDTIQFGIDVGTTAWNNNQLCVGDELLTDWAQDPPQMRGQCKYLGRTAGAPATFPCAELETFTLQSWGCLNTDSPQGAALKSFILANGLNVVAPAYLVAPSYPSSLTSPDVIDLHALVVDPSESATTAQFDGPVAGAANGITDMNMLRSFLYSVEQCYEAHFQSESVCPCSETADCNVDVGERCDNGQCQETSGTLATCPFIDFDDDVQPHPCCGDWTLEQAAGEQCDDGNVASGDGCSADCRVEAGPAACCTPNACIDLDGENSARCTALDGNLFYGTSCGALDQCGHRQQGGCQTIDGLCQQPTTLAQCERERGQFLADGCGE